MSSGRDLLLGIISQHFPGDEEAQIKFELENNANFRQEINEDVKKFYEELGNHLLTSKELRILNRNQISKNKVSLKNINQHIYRINSTNYLLSINYRWGRNEKLLPNVLIFQTENEIEIAFRNLPTYAFFQPKISPSKLNSNNGFYFESEISLERDLKLSTRKNQVILLDFYVDDEISPIFRAELFGYHYYYRMSKEINKKGGNGEKISSIPLPSSFKKIWIDISTPDIPLRRRSDFSNRSINNNNNNNNNNNDKININNNEEDDWKIKDNNMEQIEVRETKETSINIADKSGDVDGDASNASGNANDSVVVDDSDDYDSDDIEDGDVASVCNTSSNVNDNAKNSDDYDSDDESIDEDNENKEDDIAPLFNQICELQSKGENMIIAKYNMKFIFNRKNGSTFQVSAPKVNSKIDYGENGYVDLSREFQSAQQLRFVFYY